MAVSMRLSYFETSDERFELGIDYRRRTVTYPGFITQFWASMRSPKWEDYDIREAEVGEMEKL